MDSRMETQTYGPQAFYESFRWLDENDDLDLRLGFDDYTQSLRDKTPPPDQNQFDHHPSFRRHLSITKLPFSRTSMSNSRPATKDTSIAPSLKSVPPSGHIRRKSRALSLISLNKQPVREVPRPIDTAATHYQDHGARMKLREYIASPQKFDEALEYGFPSLGEVDENDDVPEGSHSQEKKRHAFLDDDKSSTHSTVIDPESPKTPPIVDKDTPAQSPRDCSEHSAHGMPSPIRFTHHSPSNSREMTMRMTLTRPDLRADGDSSHGWQHPAASRKSHAREESHVSILPDKDTEIKESMEKRFAAFDQEMHSSTQENGGLRRFWKRVRRT